MSENHDDQQIKNNAAMLADMIDKGAASTGHGEIEAMPQRAPEDMPSILWTPAAEEALRNCQALFIEALTRYYARNAKYEPGHPERWTDLDIAKLAVKTLAMNGYTEPVIRAALTDRNFRIQRQPTARIG